jgi:hypothetical protein
LSGQVDIVYQPGYLHGFVSGIHRAEVAIYQPLWEADGKISALKTRVRPYPNILWKAPIQEFVGEIDFSLRFATKSIERKDVAYAAGCCFLSVACSSKCYLRSMKNIG